jgi:FKBP-type peptidyl-prolyl cis-trans isomerase
MSFTDAFKPIIIVGIEEVLKEMRAGGEITCTIPAKLAYGSRGVCIEGQGCLVEPNTNLNYVIKLKNVAAGFN